MQNPYELLPFQIEGVNYIKERKYSYLCDDMGLGKSIQSMSAALELGAKKILIICPSSIIQQWLEVSKKFFPDYFQEVFTNKPLQSRHFSKFILVSGYSRAGTDKGKLRLHDLQYDFVIVDESHFLKNPQANRTKNILGGRSICTATGKESPGSFLANAKQVCLMSGTPILNRPSEAYIILKAFAPRSLGKYLPWPIFVRRFCGFQAKGATHTEELANILSAFILRRTKEQVLTELPPIVETVINIPGISDPEEEPIPTRRKAVSLEKVEFTIQYVQDLLQTIDKVLLIVYHRETIEKLHQAFKHSVILQGGMTNEQKQKNTTEFQTNDDCKVLIGQISVAGYGIDGLQQVCNYIVFGELDWTPGILEQAKDRLRRMGQTKTVFAHYLIASGTIEEEMDLKLEWKRDVISKLIKADDVSHLEIINPKISRKETKMVQHLEALMNDLADRIAQKVLAGMPNQPKKETKPKPTQAVTVEATPASHPDVLPDPTPTPQTSVAAIDTAPMDRAELTTKAQSLLKALKDGGVAKEEADKYYRTVILDGMKAKKIAEMEQPDLTELSKRLADHDHESALAFLLPQNNVAQEADEV